MPVFQILSRYFFIIQKDTKKQVKTVMFLKQFALLQYLAVYRYAHSDKFCIIAIYNRAIKLFSQKLYNAEIYVAIPTEQQLLSQHYEKIEEINLSKIRKTRPQIFTTQLQKWNKLLNFSYALNIEELLQLDSPSGSSDKINLDDNPNIILPKILLNKILPGSFDKSSLVGGNQLYGKNIKVYYLCALRPTTLANVNEIAQQMCLYYVRQNNITHLENFPEYDTLYYNTKECYYCGSYSGKVGLYQNFSEHNLPLNQLIRLIDYNLLSMKIYSKEMFRQKLKLIYNTYEMIVITSCINPIEIYKKDRYSTYRDQILSRIDKIIYFE